MWREWCTYPESTSTLRRSLYFHINIRTNITNYTGWNDIAHDHFNAMRKCLNWFNSAIVICTLLLLYYIIIGSSRIILSRVRWVYIPCMWTIFSVYIIIILWTYFGRTWLVCSIQTLDIRSFKRHRIAQHRFYSSSLYLLTSLSFAICLLCFLEDLLWQKALSRQVCS